MLHDEPMRLVDVAMIEDNGTWTLRNSQNKVPRINSTDLIEMTNADGSIDEFIKVHGHAIQ